MEAVENIAAALVEGKKKRGTKKQLTKRDPKGRPYKSWQGELIELDAADIVAACKLVAEPDQVVKDLLAGSESALTQGKVDSKIVTIFADDAWQLVEAATGRKVGRNGEPAG